MSMDIQGSNQEYLQCAAFQADDKPKTGPVALSRKTDQDPCTGGRCRGSPGKLPQVECFLYIYVMLPLKQPQTLHFVRGIPRMIMISKIKTKIMASKRQHGIASTLSRCKAAPYPPCQPHLIVCHVTPDVVCSAQMD